MNTLTRIYLKMFGESRPEIIEELYKLFIADLTFDQLAYIGCCYLSGKPLTEDIKEIAKLPDTVHELRYEEYELLNNIYDDKFETNVPLTSKYREIKKCWKAREQFDKAESSYY